ncbi:MAG: ABC transporter permease [Pseudobutyrivibrio sp.]|nr:ABC transporter permease [Pseudobutyrivibrio sp.]
MSSIITVSIFQSALELGLMYALVALALFISFTILNIADLTTDGCFTLGCAVGAIVTLSGHPFLGIIAAMISGACAGFVTALLQTKFGVESILAGIIVNTALYTVNIFIMTSQVSIFGVDTIFSLAKDSFLQQFFGDWYKVVILVVIVGLIALALWWFLGTTLGMSIRATGDNAEMVKSSSINPTFTITVGLCLANSLTALSGVLIAQYQKSADINIGTGMVTIALASLIIGQSLIGNKGSTLRRVIGTIAGSVLYRFIVAVALRLSVPAEALKLVSAMIVAVAIALPYVRKKAALKKREFANYRENKSGREEKNA